MQSKIAIIGLKGLPAFGGAASVGENVIRQLKHRHRFVVYAVSSHTHLKSGYYGGYEQIVFNKSYFNRFNIILYYLKSALHALFLGHYDLIHIHHRDASFIIPLLRLRYPVILTTHGMVLTEKWEKYKIFFKIQDIIFLRFSNYITCVSKKDSKISKKYNRHVIHIPNGISISTFIRQSSNAIILVFAAGRILPSKGCHVFLQSLNLLTFRGQVKVIGDYNQMPQYKNELLALSNALNVVFIGLVKDRNELYKNLCVATLFVYPSKIESMSMMLLEVASLKIPIICSDIQENKDIFDASEVLFFKTDDVLDLSQKITWALNHIDKMNRMAERAFKKVSIHFNWNTIAYKYDSIYSQFIKSD